MSERQLGIVLAVVYEFIKNGEPAGSRTITKKYIKGLSPATVRNEMSDLEDMEYFYQPHTSSGRLPTAKAYRLYVDSIMQRTRAPLAEKLDFGSARGSGVEGMLEEVTEMLGRLTRCVGFAAVSALDDTEIQRIDFVPIASSTILLLIILKGGLVYQGHFSTSYDMNPELLDEFARRINSVVSGRSWKDVRQVLYEYALSGLEDMEDVCRGAINSMEGLLDKKNYRFFSSGAHQILNLPDFQEIGKIQAVLSLLEEEKCLAAMVERCRIEQALKVSIGVENDGHNLKDNSIIFLPARARGQQAVVGLIGPLRMDYERGISVLESIVAAMEGEDDGR